MYIIAINKPENDHLEAVKAYMAEHGAPTIKAVYDEANGSWVALEGSHRLAAAHALGLPVEIDEVDYSDDLLVNIVTIGQEDRDDLTVADIYDSAWERASYLTYRFD